MLRLGVAGEAGTCRLAGKQGRHLRAGARWGGVDRRAGMRDLGAGWAQLGCPLARTVPRSCSPVRMPRLASPSVPTCPPACCRDSGLPADGPAPGVHRQRAHHLSLLGRWRPTAGTSGWGEALPKQRHEPRLISATGVSRCGLCNSNNNRINPPSTHRRLCRSWPSISGGRARGCPARWRAAPRSQSSACSAAVGWSSTSRWPRSSRCRRAAGCAARTCAFGVGVCAA